MQEEKIKEYVGMFDVVVEHIFNILHKGVNLPPFMDFENVFKAQQEALLMHKQGVLKEFYVRIKKGAI